MKKFWLVVIKEYHNTLKVMIKNADQDPEKYKEWLVDHLFIKKEDITITPVDHVQLFI